MCPQTTQGKALHQHAIYIAGTLYNSNGGDNMLGPKILGDALVKTASLLFTVNSDDLPLPGDYDMGLPIPGQDMDLPLPGERHARKL